MAIRSACRTGVCVRTMTPANATMRRRQTRCIGAGYHRLVSIDLLVFGPHPDDLEIGLGGTIARHTAEGHVVGLCDLTEGEMSSNGTVAERRDEAAAAARVLGAAWRENLRWPDGDIAPTPEMVRSAVDLIRRHRPRAIAVPYWDDRHPDHVAASQVLRLAAYKSRLGPA